MKTFIALALLSFASTPAFAEITPRALADLPAVLNTTCGDAWCDGGDYHYDFKKAAFDGLANRLTLTLVMAPYDRDGEIDHGKAKTLKCVMYNFDSDKQLGGTRSLSDGFYLEVTNCLDTLEANL